MTGLLTAVVNSWQANSSEERANGVVSSSGRDRPASDLPDRIGKKLMIRRNDHVRLLQQALRKLGYSSVADRLEEESVIIPVMPTFCMEQRKPCNYKF